MAKKTPRGGGSAPSNAGSQLWPNGFGRAGYVKIALTGSLFVASPKMKDPVLRKSVFFMLDKQDRGVLAFQLNRPFVVIQKGDRPEPLRLSHFQFQGDLPLTIKRADWDLPIFNGGPVNMGKICCFHSPDFSRKGSFPIAENLCFTESDGSFLQETIAGRGPRQARFISGYNAWNWRSLTNEWGRGDWLAMLWEPDLVFEPDDSRLWEKALARYHAPARRPFNPFYAQYADQSMPTYSVQ